MSLTELSIDINTSVSEDREMSLSLAEIAYAKNKLDKLFVTSDGGGLPRQPFAYGEFLLGVTSFEPLGDLDRLDKMDAVTITVTDRDVGEC